MAAANRRAERSSFASSRSELVMTRLAGSLRRGPCGAGGKGLAPLAEALFAAEKTPERPGARPPETPRADQLRRMFRDLPDDGGPRPQHALHYPLDVAHRVRRADRLKMVLRR